MEQVTVRSEVKFAFTAVIMNKTAKKVVVPRRNMLLMASMYRSSVLAVHQARYCRHLLCSQRIPFR